MNYKKNGFDSRFFYTHNLTSMLQHLFIFALLYKRLWQNYLALVFGQQLLELF